jgi:pimeloyl-ACP methyl ester carboxylesterase
MTSDALCCDAAPEDEQHPATSMPLTFLSHGERLLGSILVAQGAGPHPTILLLHGFPGYEQNGDLAHSLRRAGWNVVTFHYRGAWGSQGTFTFSNALEDVHVALRLLRTPQLRLQGRVERERIVLVGHSMGGFAALLAAATVPSVQAVASLATFDFGRFAQALRQENDLVATTTEEWKVYLPPLHAPSAEYLVAEVLRHADTWRLDRYLDQLAQRHVLLLAADRDTVAPPRLHHAPLVAALHERVAPLRSSVLPGDHAFSNARVAMARSLLTWLEEVHLSLR